MVTTNQYDSPKLTNKKRAAMRVGTHITALPAEPGTTAQQDGDHYIKIHSSRISRGYLSG